LSEKIKAEESSCRLSLPTAHASFLRERLLPSAKLIQTAHLKASGLDLLLPLLDDNYSGRGRPVWNALAFTVDYASIQLDDDDERRWEVETAEDVLHDPWFAPDRWRDNMRHLRPVLIGKTESSIPPNIRFRIAEVYRSFTFGTWMATIALCRATVEFSLIDCSQSLGFSATRKGKGGDRYLMLNDIIGLTIPKLPTLRESLVAFKKAGILLLHPDTRRK